MKKGVKNIAVSVRNKLINIAEKEQKDYNTILRLYFQERFLYRLSISPYKNKLILKGALLLMAKDISRFRPTRDIDFLGRALPNEIGDCRAVISEIAGISVDDGVIFETEKIRAERIKEEADYSGIRIHIPYKMDTITGNISIDIGFGDKIVDGPKEVSFPVILAQEPRPNIMAYSFESAIAEKFDTIVKLNVLTSRMKDFYDIFFLASNISFKSNIMKEALETTFFTRGTQIEDRAIIYGNEFKNDTVKNNQWIIFLSKNKIELETSFALIIEKLKDFIEPLFSNSSIMSWNYSTWQWIKD
ncbi:MAG TPA: nucleotidyl transferase AbiEii/AbiGii toxin family protein [Ignavibacteriales bacterium]|nr:nucleotidyl transferase AbiEii/AbiGii toxin family protein [Ignavibacteriales bacterium]